MNINKMTHTVMSLAAMAVIAGNAHAAIVSSSVVSTTMAVASATCTVAAANASIAIPSASPKKSTQSYMDDNNIKLDGGLNQFSSIAFNQTATITCSAANTPITSVVVQPAASANVAANADGYQIFKDTGVGSAMVVAGGNNTAYGWAWSSELVSVNGLPQSPVFQFSDGTTNASKGYTTGFLTGALVSGSSKATLVWRPNVTKGTDALIGTPAGGKFTGAYLVTVNY